MNAKELVAALVRVIDVAHFDHVNTRGMLELVKLRNEAQAFLTQPDEDQEEDGNNADPAE